MYLLYNVAWGGNDRSARGFRSFTHTIQSTASMRDRSLVGRPMASRMMAMVMMPPAGIPAAPTLEAVAVTLETMMTLLNE